MVKRNAASTRGDLLEAAFHEMHEHGTRGTSLDRILSRTGLTKGALYHHFKNKDELVLAVVDEVIGNYIQQTWVKPVMEADDPLAAMIESINRTWEDVPEEASRLGCPLNRLGQESELDSSLQDHIESVYRNWRDSLATAFSRGQERGFVKPDVDVVGLATFLVISHQGFSSLMKCKENQTELKSASDILIRLLESYRLQN